LAISNNQVVKDCISREAIMISAYDTLLDNKDKIMLALYLFGTARILMHIPLLDKRQDEVEFMGRRLCNGMADINITLTKLSISMPKYATKCMGREPDPYNPSPLRYMIFVVTTPAGTNGFNLFETFFRVSEDEMDRIDVVCDFTDPLRNFGEQ
jgi:hypothetical protein